MQRFHVILIKLFTQFILQIDGIPTIQKTIHLTFPSIVLSGNFLISNGNRTEWSPIRSVIIRVINKIGRPRSGSLICLITSMITDRIGRHEVLLPVNHNFNKICNIIRYFLNQNTRNSKFCFASSEKKGHLTARVMARTVQLLGTKPRRRRQRERQKTIGLMSKTTALHVRHAFLYISLPSLYNYDVK